MKHGFSVLESTLEQMGNSMKRSISIYLIGGGALVFKELKDSTKDIDAIFESAADLKAFAAALEVLGYASTHRKEPAYGKARNVLAKKNSPSFDLFFDDICGGLHFTGTMKQRATLWKRYGNLAVHLLSNEDILLFKSVAGREGDVEDCVEIVRRVPKWNAITKEIERQKLITTAEWMPQFAHFVLRLHNDYKIDIPALDKLVGRGEKSLIHNLIKEKLKRGKAKGEICTELEITEREFEELN